MMRRSLSGPSIFGLVLALLMASLGIILLVFLLAFFR